MISAIIIDDEQHCIDRLSSLLKENHQDTIILTGTFSTIEEGLAAISKLQPQLVFLDVQIHDRTGFDLLKQLSKIHFDIIFTTAYEKYAVQAIKFSALDYLLKPVSAEDLGIAIAKIAEKMAKNDTSAKLDTLFHNLKNIQGMSKKYVSR